MLNRNVISLIKINRGRINTLVIRTITGKDVIERNQVTNARSKYDIVTQPEEFRKEFLTTHWLGHYTDKLKLWIRAPFNLRIWSHQKDTELGRFTWNTNGYQNSLSNILYRNEKLQTKELMNFMVKNFDHRFTLSVNKAEEPPRISTNSVFLYRDSTYTVVSRRSVERFAFMMILSMAWNPSTLVMYTFLGLYFQLVNRNYFASVCTSFRMDLLPETEQIHIVKIGPMGFPRSVLVNVRDLVKIDKAEEKLYPLRWFKSRIWIPYEDDYMIFKDTTTNEVFTFNKKGIWNEQGLEHPLLN